jgi:O-methyltransferase
MRQYPTYGEVLGHLLADQDQVFTAGKPCAFQHIHSLLPEVEHVPGLFAEIGTNKGMSAKFTAIMCPERTIHCYDTFAGIVGGRVKDGEYGEHVHWVSYDECKTNLAGHNCIIHPGIFPETFDLWDEKFAFVYSDTDTYFGTMESLRVFYPRMSPGGVILVDDVDHPNAPLIRKALDDFGVPWHNNKAAMQGVIRVP